MDSVDKKDISKYMEFKKNEKSVKNLILDNLKKYAKDELKNKNKNLNISKISDEKILEAFSLIDVHTKIFEQISAINSYNQIVQTISMLLVTTEKWNESIDTCKSIINDYYSVYIDDSKIEQANTIQVEFCNNIKQYVVDNCLLVFAIKNKDRELLGALNKSINTTLSNLFKLISGPVRPELIENNNKEKKEENAKL